MQTQATHTQPKATKVVGAGGRRRTVYICAASCWHNSMSQALKCKNAAALTRCDICQQPDGKHYYACPKRTPR